MTEADRNRAYLAVRPWADLAAPWREQAACRGKPAKVFYPAGEDWTDRQRPNPAEALARETCARCPVREECLAFAIDAREPDGIWGGLNARERARLRGGTRWCRSCGALKPPTAFDPCERGHRNECQDCRRRRVAEYDRARRAG